MIGEFRTEVKTKINKFVWECKKLYYLIKFLIKGVWL